ncbi:MAG: putative glycosyltransferase [Marmoricola sp.]|nr:putative glycosyltransferase [Marmoricola sp.]
MANYLFVTWDGGGNVTPAVGIATELKSRGHRVRFLGHEVQRNDLAGAGFEFTAYERGRAFSSQDTNSPNVMMALFSDKGMGEDVLAAVAAHPADVVIVDCLLTGAQKACADAGLTYVSLEHFFDGFLRKNWLRGPMGITARAKGLRPLRTWNAAALVLVVSLPELDPGHNRKMPANVRYSGPILVAPAARDWSDEEPAVLVSLSTYNFGGMTEAMQHILDATADLDAKVIVTTGPVIDPASLRVGANAEVHRYVPHDRLMPKASLVIGHGGHATTMRALAHDLPLVVMPMHPMLDQPMVGQSVERAGAGRLVRKGAKAESLRPVIAELLADGPHRLAAARLGAAIRGMAGTVTAADLIEQCGPVNGAPGSQSLRSRT